MDNIAGGIGLAVILILYFSVGVFAVIGSAVFTGRYLPVRWEQAFYAGFLMAIAGFYLAFTAYFGETSAWPLESGAVALFCLFGLLGLRWLPLLMLGYVLHGLWDLVHEIRVYTGLEVVDASLMTAVPLAYGVFCATFDMGICVYFWKRRVAWQEARVIDRLNASAARFAANAELRRAQGKL